MAYKNLVVLAERSVGRWLSGGFIGFQNVGLEGGVWKGAEIGEHHIYWLTIHTTHSMDTAYYLAYTLLIIYLVHTIRCTFADQVVGTA